MPRPKTREVTLHRLPNVAPTHEGMFDALTEAVGAGRLDGIGADPQPITVAGSPALWLDGQFSAQKADWCADATRTTGLDISYGNTHSAGLLLIAVDGTVYAIGYGGGHRLIPDELTDPRFGLRFAIRRLDPGQIQDFVRRMPGSRGRTDATSMAAGLPVWTLGVEQHADITCRIGGQLNGMQLTFSSRDNRAVRAEGSAGLRMRLGVEPDDLVSDIREIARICEHEQPHPALGFVEHIQPTCDRETLAELDAALDERLGSECAADELVPVVPTSALDDFRQTRTFAIKIGTVWSPLVYSLEAAHFLQRSRVQLAGRRVAALRNGQVRMFSDEVGRESLGSVSALKWLEATVSVGSRRFFLLDGHWYEIGADYARATQAEIARFFGNGTPSLDLPAWELTKGWKERDYNEFVPGVRPGYVCLDRQGVRDPLGAGSIVEICDLLGPHNELIHVKRASGSSPLSHLFAQGLVSAQSLLFSADARERFAAKVKHLGKGRAIRSDFIPAKVVFAILLKKGDQLTPSTLFPFSQVTLAHTSRMLQSHQINVEVIGIESGT
jgi:uncharacterized protein (TIGR04141 family)